MNEREKVRTAHTSCNHASSTNTTKLSNTQISTHALIVSQPHSSPQNHTATPAEFSVSVHREKKEIEM